MNIDERKPEMHVAVLFYCNTWGKCTKHETFIWASTQKNCRQGSDKVRNKLVSSATETS